MANPNQNNNHDQRETKIFVGGLAWKTTTDGLREFFQQNFGEVLHANVVLEPSPGGRSKGYGFVTFRDVEAAARACEPPHPMIDGRKTNINLAYLRAKTNNTNHSNQNGVMHQAGPSHQYQNVLISGSFNQAGPSHQYQQPIFQYYPHFPQVYWNPSYGQYCYTHNVQYYPYSTSTSNTMFSHSVSTWLQQKWHQRNNGARVTISKPPKALPSLQLEEINETSQEVDSADVEPKDHKQEADTEPDCDVVDQDKKGEDQEGESIGQEKSRDLF